MGNTIQNLIPFRSTPPKNLGQRAPKELRSNNQFELCKTAFVVACYKLSTKETSMVKKLVFSRHFLLFALAAMLMISPAFQVGPSQAVAAVQDTDSEEQETDDEAAEGSETDDAASEPDDAAGESADDAADDGEGTDEEATGEAAEAPRMAG